MASAIAGRSVAGVPADAVPLPLRNIQAAQVIGSIAAWAGDRIGLSEHARVVRLHPDVVGHIIRRRGEVDSSFVLENLGEAIRNPQMIGTEARDSRRLRLVHRVDGAARWVHVSLKQVLAIDSKSALDETWVSTAFPMGTLIRLLRNKPTLWHVLDL